MILENYKQTNHYKLKTVKETTKQNDHSDKEEREFLTPTKTVKIRPLTIFHNFILQNVLMHYE